MSGPTTAAGTGDMTATSPAMTDGSWTCNGHVVDRAAIGQLEPATDLLGDPDGLRQAMDERGYLFFPGLVPAEAVLAARREILTKYAIIGEVDDRGFDGTGTVMDALAADPEGLDHVNLRAFSDSVRSGAAYTAVVEAEPLMAMYRGLLGGEVRCFDFRWPRFVRPGEGCGFHCDGPYMNRGTDLVYSSWIPLGDVTPEDGALMILAGSHRNEALHRGYLAKDADLDGLVWLDDDPAEVQRRYGDRWLTADFEPGDVLCFTMHTLHGAFDNRSPRGRCRLSSDSRYQRADEPADARWNELDRLGQTEGHGGSRVFYPGLGRWRNADFQDEWKYVDDRGRIMLPDASP